MLLFEQTDIVKNVYQRALCLAIGKEFANKKNGAFYTNAKQNSEQENSRRELLAIEEEAKKNKIIEEHGQSVFKAHVKNKFIEKVSGQLNTTFENKEHLYQHILHIEDAAPAILDLLSLKAASVNRIAPLVKSLPWLANELIKLVNKPQYRKRADIKVTDANLAINYIGLDNLKLVIPVFILKHWLPVSTSPFPLLKRKLWSDSLSVALASKALAEHQDIDWYPAFAAGMMSNVGLLAVARCVITTYNDTYNADVREAYDNKDKRLHDVLVQLDATPDLLLEQLETRSSEICANLIEQMNFERLQITEPLFDIAYTNSASKLTTIGLIVAKAHAYVSFRNLAKEDLIENDEAKSLLATAKMTAQEVTLLKKTDIDHIKLNFK